MALKIVGFIFIAIGLVDMIGSWTGFDLWTDFIGVDLPPAIWQFTAYIEIGIGYFLLKLGSGKSDPVQE